MKQFKKRTLALVLASVITVVGSFAAENYKNSIMRLDFVGQPSGNVDMVVQTKTNYTGQITPTRMDNNTYLLMLPEFNSEAVTPDLSKVSGVIESVNIKTLPYSGNNKGYTKVIIKTFGNTALTATSKLYIPEQKRPEISYNPENYNRSNSQGTNNNASSSTKQNKKKHSKQSVNNKKIKNKPFNQSDLNKKPVSKNQEVNVSVEKPEAPAQTTNPQNTTVAADNTSSDTNQRYMFILGGILLIAIIAFIYLKAKDKLVDVVGEKLEIDTSDEENQEKKPKEKPTPKKIQKPVNKPLPQMPNVSQEQQIMPAEQLDIVDLDKLFQEQNSQGSEEDGSEGNSDLDDFLKEFSFEEEETEPAVEEPLYDEEAFERIMGSSIKFTKDDVKCVNDLLNSEIQENTLNNIEKYAVSNPIAAKKPSQKEVLEKLVTELAISQNITFTGNDVDALKKLISVEIDPDFITDLRTNPERTKQMSNEIENQTAKPNKSRILTLHVKEMLPNLSEELSKQGKHIDSDGVKPMTVYYSEGYEYTKLKVDDLPDLAAELNNKAAYTSKPSYKEKIVETGYEYESFATDGSLPDLADVMAHPEKYKEAPKIKAKADEQTMLERLMNVQFKPFDDGSNKFEVLNHFDEEPVPSVDDIQQEFSQFGDFKIADEEQDNTSGMKSSDYDDFESIYSNDFVDLDKDFKKEKEEEKQEEQEEQQQEEQQEEEQKSITLEVEQENEEEKQEEYIEPQILAVSELQEQQKIEPVNKVEIEQKPEPKFEQPVKREQPQRAEELLKKIEASKLERASLREKQVSSKPIPKPVAVSNQEKITSKQEVIKCVFEGVNYNIVSTAQLGQNIGCHLAKNEKGYVVLAYEGDNLSKLKEYGSVSLEKIQARLNERIANGAPRYIVRVGANKFIVDIKDNHVCYVMDLC